MLDSAGLSEPVFPLASAPPLVVSRADRRDFVRPHQVTVAVPASIETGGGADLVRLTGDDPCTLEGTVPDGAGSDLLFVFDRNDSTGACGTVTPIPTSREEFGPDNPVIAHYAGLGETASRSDWAGEPPPVTREAALPAPDVANRLPARRPELLLRPLGEEGRHVVKDPHTGAFFLLGEQEFFLLSQLDGERDAAAVVRAFQERFGEPLSEEEVAGFVELTRAKGFLLPDGPAAPEPSSPAVGTPPQASPAPEPPAPAPRTRQSILYWRKNFFDPDRFFTWLAPRIGFLWTRAFLLLSAGCILLAAVLAWSNGREFASCFASAWRWETVVLVWLALLATTFCHEFAHGLTCKHYGGEVHEVGFLLMFFVPCFYCNVSDAWLFKEKSRRLWVTLAGGYCDLCLWTLAVFAWRLAAPDSLPNYLAWVMLTVLGARVFFNFNPLLKLDGYYLLSDALELHNLRQRSWDRVAGWLRCLLWGAPRPAPAPRARFLLAYGLTSWLFSLAFLALMIVGFYQFLGARWGLVGAAPAVLLGVVSLRGMFQGFNRGEVRQMILTRPKRAVAWLLVPAFLAPAWFLWEMEDRSGGPFEVRPVVRAELRAPVAGFLREVYRDEGERVYAGAVVARLEIPELDSKLARKRAEVREGEARVRLLRAGARPEEVAEQRGRVERARAMRDLADGDLARARRVLREELANLQTQVEQYQAEQDFARGVLGRSRGLVRQRSLPPEQYEAAGKYLQVTRAQRQQAETRKQAQQERGTQEAELELARREKELADAQATLRLLEAGTRPEEIDAEEARLARLREEACYLEGQQKKLQVTSPVPGLLTTPRMKEKIGRYVQEGDLIAEVEEPDVLEGEIALTEQDVARVRPGHRVELKCRALPFQTFQGQVERIAPRTSPAEAPAIAAKPARGELAGTVTVYCRFEGADEGLRPGMTGHARVYGGRRPVGELLTDRLLRFLRTEFWW